MSATYTGDGSPEGEIVGRSGGKLGFYGLATPIVKPTAAADATGFTAGSGTAAKDDSTFTGASGSTAYTVGDIVTALKALGLITA
jgi:hypothetical protein